MRNPQDALREVTNALDAAYFHLTERPAPTLTDTRQAMLDVDARHNKMAAAFAPAFADLMTYTANRIYLIEHLASWKHPARAAMLYAILDHADDGRSFTAKPPVLDFGGGAGHVALTLNLLDIPCVLLDYASLSTTAAQIAAALLKVQCPILNPAAALAIVEPFDNIIVLDVLEHSRDLLQTLSALNRLAATGAYIYEHTDYVVSKTTRPVHPSADSKSRAIVTNFFRAAGFTTTTIDAAVRLHVGDIAPPDPKLRKLMK